MEVECFEDKERCVFCKDRTVDELRLGKIYKYENIVTHYFCMLFSAEIQQNGRDNEGIQGFLPEDIQKEANRAEKCLCAYCRVPGATINCSFKACKKRFHYSCGVESGSLHQFFDNFKSFCVGHRKWQVVPANFSTLERHMCLICYEDVKPRPTLTSLWAPCCRTAWFHRTCIQKMALNGGYFFRCPKCNNREVFRREMLECGIYIPDQDASWEMEPHAYEELAQRHNVCDATVCQCPYGRTDYSYETWELILCQYCGSQGTHQQCSLAAINEQGGKWTCPVCLSVTRPSRSVSHEVAEELPVPGPSIVVRENVRPRRKKSHGTRHRRRIGSDEEISSLKRAKRIELEEDSDCESATSSMSGYGNSSREVQCSVPVLEESDENESDVEFGMRSTARLENQPVIVISNNSNMLPASSNAVIELDSDGDDLPSQMNTSDNNEVTSTSVDIIDDDNEDTDDDDVVFVSEQKNELPPATALLKFVKNNKVFIIRPTDARRIGIENLAAMYYPEDSSSTNLPPPPSRDTPMWKPVPLEKSMILRREMDQDLNLNCSSLNAVLGSINSNRDLKEKENDIICID